jgi:hypothetical protein
MHALRDKGINVAEYRLFRHVREVRNSAVHNVKAITPGEAAEYKTICDTLTKALTDAFERARVEIGGI